MNWWQRLNQRERFLLGVAIPVVIVVILYTNLFQPTYDKVRSLRLSVPEDNATLAWMKFQLQESPSVAVSGQDNAVVNDKPLLTEVETVAKQARIAASIQRVQPDRSNNVEIWFQEVVADRLLDGIDKLAKRNIAIASATITRGKPGMVSARIKLTRQ